MANFFRRGYYSLLGLVACLYRDRWRITDYDSDNNLPTTEREKMNVSNACIELIKSFEGFCGHPYLCPAGVPTIGYGSTHYANGVAVGMSDGDISESDAETLLMVTLNDNYATTVNHYITSDINQNQFDALCDFC